MIQLIANTPPPPYYAVIFTSIRTDGDYDYGNVANRMLELASQQKGFLGFETVKDEIGISVSYWSSLEAIHNWKINTEHQNAQQSANKWYSHYRIRVCRVEKEYGI